MRSYLRIDENGEPEGVVENEYGREIVVDDMELFSKICQVKPPYFDFIFRPKPNTLLPVVWKTLLKDTIFEVDSEGEAEMSLRDYQYEGIQTVIEKYDGRALLAADMGMGKTMMGCLLSKHYGGRRLFIVPSSVVPNWLAEYALIFGKDAPIHNFNTRKSVIKGDVVITTFGLFRDCPVLHNGEWDFLLVDESQWIKHDSGQGKAIRNLSLRVKECILLSGTPLEGSTLDLFNQLYCLYPKVFTNRSTFIHRFSVGTYDNFGKWISHGASNEDELNMILNTLMVRMLDTRQTNLPERHRYVQPMECAGDNKKAVDRLANELKMCTAKIQKMKKGKDANNLREIRKYEFEKLQITNQLRNLSGIIKASICGPWFKKFETSKEKDDKYVFYVEHVSTRKALSETLESLGYEFDFIDGGVDSSTRTTLIKRMQDSNDSLRALIVSYKTCSVGISFCPGTCYTIFVELAYLPTTMLQAEKRTNRDGATKDAHYIWLSLAGTTDDKIIKKLQSRFRDMRHVVDGDKDQVMEFVKMPKFSEDVSRKRTHSASQSQNVGDKILAEELSGSEDDLRKELLLGE